MKCLVNCCLTLNPAPAVPPATALLQCLQPTVAIKPDPDALTTSTDVPAVIVPATIVKPEPKESLLHAPTAVRTAAGSAAHAAAKSLVPTRPRFKSDPDAAHPRAGHFPDASPACKTLVPATPFPGPCTNVGSGGEHTTSTPMQQGTPEVFIPSPVKPSPAPNPEPVGKPQSTPQVLIPSPHKPHPATDQYMPSPCKSLAADAACIPLPHKSAPDLVHADPSHPEDPLYRRAITYLADLLGPSLESGASLDPPAPQLFATGCGMEDTLYVACQPDSARDWEDLAMVGQLLASAYPEDNCDLLLEGDEEGLDLPALELTAGCESNLSADPQHPSSELSAPPRLAFPAEGRDAQGVKPAPVPASTSPPIPTNLHLPIHPSAGQRVPCWPTSRPAPTHMPSLTSASEGQGTEGSALSPYAPQPLAVPFNMAVPARPADGRLPGAMLASTHPDNTSEFHCCYALFACWARLLFLSSIYAISRSQHPEP